MKEDKQLRPDNGGERSSRPGRQGRNRERRTENAPERVARFDSDSEEEAPGEPLPIGDRPKVGITHGDFNGIGYEVILRML